MTCSGSLRARSTVASVDESSTRMISSTHSSGIAETVRSSVRSALRAGITTMIFWVRSGTARLHVHGPAAAGDELDGRADEGGRREQHARGEGGQAPRRRHRLAARLGPADGVVEGRMARDDLADQPIDPAVEDLAAAPRAGAL